MTAEEAHCISKVASPRLNNAAHFHASNMRCPVLLSTVLLLFTMHTIRFSLCGTYLLLFAMLCPVLRQHYPAPRQPTRSPRTASALRASWKRQARHPTPSLRAVRYRRRFIAVLT